MRGPMPNRHQFPTFACSLILSGPLLWGMGLPARADAPVSCPAPRAVFRDKTQPIHQPSVATGGDIELEGDKVIAGLNGNATATGNVVARQGQRVVKSEDAEYDSDTSECGCAVRSTMRIRSST